MTIVHIIRKIKSKQKGLHVKGTATITVKTANGLKKTVKVKVE